MIGNIVPIGVKPEIVATFSCTKSSLSARSDGKGYTTPGMSGYAETPTSAQWSQYNSSSVVCLNIYGYMPGLGLWLMYSVVLFPTLGRKEWFQSTVNQIYPTRWIQTMSASSDEYGDGGPYGILSTDIYSNISSSSETVFKFEYIKLL